MTGQRVKNYTNLYGVARHAREESVAPSAQQRRAKENLKRQDLKRQDLKRQDPKRQDPKRQEEQKNR